MSNDLYNKVMEEMSAKKIIDHASMPYEVRHVIDSEAVKVEHQNTLSVAHYIGRLQRQKQGYEF